MASASNSLELVVLGLLKEQDMHGYELKKRITESFEPIMRVSWGSLYPALARLESKGAVKAVEARPLMSSVPMTGSLGGERAAFRGAIENSRGSRNKKVYGITDFGSSLFFELLITITLTTKRAFQFGLHLLSILILKCASRCSKTAETGF
ncbi:MAG: PadR family transcriptional regulator [Actinobacteria bacterium]|nr:PadR family transcriptional regulator [Actinomycetota bacterium]